MGDNKDKQITENDMAQALNVTDESAAHDATAKKLVANKAILAYILKYTMDEFADTPLIYYGSRMISAQKGTVFTGQHYEKIQKIVSVWICVGTAEDRADSINDYQFQESCRHGDYKEDPENYDLEKIVVIRLGAKGKKSDNPMVRLLSKLFSETLSKEEKKEMLPNEFNIAPIVSESLSTVKRWFAERPSVAE